MLIGSSLKMYFGRSRTLEWTRAVTDICVRHRAVREGLVEPFVIPSFPSIPEVVRVAVDTGMLVGAQNLHWEDSGAYTGEVSAGELAEHGVTLVEIGHAERRTIFGETDDIVARKVAAALRHGLTPLLCIGESVRADPDSAVAPCIAQLDASLAAAAQAGMGGRLVVAYEPVWAIGARVPADVDHIRTVTRALRAHLADSAFASQVIYGGSAGPGLLPRIGDAVDGMFLGRYAHDPAAFGRILDEVLELKEKR
ncbi:triose-phosphate isomerase family protein [Microbacterium sp. NPDC089318]